MPLAGSMRLRTFAIMMAIALGLASFGIYKACDRGKGDEPAKQIPVAEPVRQPEPERDHILVPEERPVDPPAPSFDLAARPHDADVLAWNGKKVAAGKGKDVAKGKRYKINVYQDKGFAGANRAKVDLDKDDRWDEKYTFEPDKITLQRAPDDDEQYTETYHWTGEAWISADRGAGDDPKPATGPASAEPVAETPPTRPATKADLAARAHDADVLAFEGRDLGSDKIKDAVKGGGFKVNVYQDAGKSTANRAKVDLDGDEKWDEKYTFAPGRVTLQRAPEDDEQYTETYHWTGDGWAKAR